MKILVKKNDRGLVLELIIFIILFFIMTNFQIQNFLTNQENFVNPLDDEKTLVFTQDAINDTTAPIITFVQPEVNNTIIKKISYTIIVNISDENPPLFGNVTIQFSNFTNFLFNAIMNNTGGTLWSFNWNNISSYPNQYYRGYVIQIMAKDSSLNENLGLSGEYYIFLNVPEQTPGILNFFIYLILVSFILAGIIVYLNRKMLRKVSDKKKGNQKEVYEY
ncbi:MAG: hypothetical protein ACFFDF_22140 [Candidatus Odinarchaeota archaeon]